MSQVPIFKPTSQLETEEALEGYIYFEEGRLSTEHLWEVYSSIKRKGGASNQQQDILRSMLIMAAAALEVSIKKCLILVLKRLVAGNHKSKEAIIKKANRKMLGKSDDKDMNNVTEAQTRVIFSALLADNPRDIIIENSIEEELKDSLQSVKRIREIYSLAGFDLNPISTRERVLSNAFDARNLIIHQLDCAPKTARGIKRRTPRNKDEILQWTNALLEITYDFLSQANKEILSLPSSSR